MEISLENLYVDTGAWYAVMVHCAFIFNKLPFKNNYAKYFFTSRLGVTASFRII